MPNRLIREGYLDSERINSLSANAERFYFRLLLNCDDAGRCDGRAQYLSARCWPLDPRRPTDISAWLQECAEAGLLFLYEFDGHPFVQVARWQRCGSSARSKYPWRDGSYEIQYVILPQRHGDKEDRAFVTTSMDTPSAPPTHPVGTPCVGETPRQGVPSSSTSTSTSSTANDAFNLPQSLDTPLFREAWAKWVQHRKEIRRKLTPTAVHQQWKRLATMGAARAIAAIEHSIGNGWTGIFEADEKKGKPGPKPLTNPDAMSRAFKAVNESSARAAEQFYGKVVAK